jgi:ubiquinone/menaquinone biosynthesis C-methylase UbiE
VSSKPTLAAGRPSPVVDYAALAEEYGRHRKVHPQVLQDLLEESRIDPQSTVLEVGCGTGNYVTALESAVHCRSWGMDPSPEMLAEAGKRLGAVQFHVGRAEEIPFSAEFFDLVFSVDVIHHLEDVRRYFEVARLVLKPGGRICTVTDSEWIIRNREPLAVYFPETIDVDLERYPRLSELRTLTLNAGFEMLFEHTAQFPYELMDAQPYRDRAFSSLHLVGEEHWRRGLARLERDLQSGPIPCVSRYTLLWGKRPPGSLWG